MKPHGDPEDDFLDIAVKKGSNEAGENADSMPDMKPSIDDSWNELQYWREGRLSCVLSTGFPVLPHSPRGQETIVCTSLPLSMHGGASDSSEGGGTNVGWELVRMTAMALV